MCNPAGVMVPSIAEELVLSNDKIYSAIPRYGRFGVDGLTVECKRCQENSCRRGATLFPSLCRPVFTLVNALALLRLQGLVAPSGHVLSWWRSRKQVQETTEKL